MLSQGNGDPRVCAANLLRTVRGEVPLERIKGIAREHIDSPSTSADAMRADALWVLETFEPRLTADDASVMARSAQDGDFGLTVEVE